MAIEFQVGLGDREGKYRYVNRMVKGDFKYFTKVWHKDTDNVSSSEYVGVDTVDYALGVCHGGASVSKQNRYTGMLASKIATQTGDPTDYKIKTTQMVLGNLDLDYAIVYGCNVLKDDKGENKIHIQNVMDGGLHLLFGFSDIMWGRTRVIETFIGNCSKKNGLTTQVNAWKKTAGTIVFQGKGLSGGAAQKEPWAWVSWVDLPRPLNRRARGYGPGQQSFIDVLPSDLNKGLILTPDYYRKKIDAEKDNVYIRVRHKVANKIVDFNRAYWGIGVPPSQH